MEYSISAIKFATLKGQSADAVRPNSNEKIEYDSRRRVVGTKVILAKQFFLIIIMVFL